MGQLIVRNIEDEIIKALKRRAKKNDRSAEEEHRQLLRSVLGKQGTKRTFKDLLHPIPDGGDDMDFLRSDDPGRKIDL